MNDTGGGSAASTPSPGPGGGNKRRSPRSTTSPDAAPTAPSRSPDDTKKYARAAAYAFIGGMYSKKKMAAVAYDIPVQNMEYYIQKFKDGTSKSVARGIATRFPPPPPVVPVVSGDRTLDDGVEDMRKRQKTIKTDSAVAAQYRKAFILVGDLLRGDPNMSMKQAIGIGWQKTGYELSRSTAHKAKNAPAENPYPQGPMHRPCKYPKEAEDQLIKVILELRALRLDTGRHTVMVTAAKMLIDTPYESMFTNPKTGRIRIDKSFFEGLCSRHPGVIKIADAKTTEAPRVKWGKSKYLMTVQFSFSFPALYNSTG